jgi:glycosyltransferase involved in cell wall biosynthesis
MTRLNIGGPARQGLFLTRELPARGFETQLVWGSAGLHEGQFDPPEGLANIHIPELRRELRPRADRAVARQLGEIVRDYRPHIVHTHLAKAGAIGRFVAHREDVPVVVHTFHGHVLQEYFSALKNRAFLAAERSLARRTDALVAVAPWVREELLAMGVGREEQWRVIPVGIDLRPYYKQRVPAAKARARLGLPPDGPIVGCVGRLVAIKDHRTLLEAAARLLADRPDATFVLAGDGELRAKLQAEARALLGDRCVFLGWVDDLPTLYSAFDVVALTSRLEGTPVSLIEAAAAGKPVVATNVGGVSEVVRDGNTGLLVPPSNPVAVATSIENLLADPEGARRMGEEGATWVRQRFSEDRLADDITALYREILERKVGRNEIALPAKERAIA